MHHGRQGLRVLFGRLQELRQDEIGGVCGKGLQRDFPELDRPSQTRQLFVNQTGIGIVSDGQYTRKEHHVGVHEKKEDR